MKMKIKIISESLMYPYAFYNYFVGQKFTVKKEPNNQGDVIIFVNRETRKKLPDGFKHIKCGMVYKNDYEIVKKQE